MRVLKIFVQNSKVWKNRRFNNFCKKRFYSLRTIQVEQGKGLDAVSYLFCFRAFHGRRLKYHKLVLSLTERTWEYVQDIFPTQLLLVDHMQQLCGLYSSSKNHRVDQSLVSCNVEGWRVIKDSLRIVKLFFYSTCTLWI